VLNGGVKDLLKGLIGSLLRSARRDPHLEVVSRGRRCSHDDGWGYVLLNPSSHMDMAYVRRSAPIYRDGEGVKSLEGFIDRCRGVVVGLIHARKAGSPGASGVDAHPYHVVTRDLWDAWLAHNGRVDEEVLGGMAGVSNPASRPDSLVLAKFLGMGIYSDVGRRLRAVVRELLRRL